LSYHPQAKTLPGEELNCFYLDVLEQLRFFGLSRDVYCKEEERIHEEWFHGPHTGKAEETATAIAG
jgi:hypothetical protein